MNENEIAKKILDNAFLVHTKLGPGLLESVYEVVLAHELKKAGLLVERDERFGCFVMPGRLLDGAAVRLQNALEVDMPAFGFVREGLRFALLLDCPGAPPVYSNR